MFLPTLPRRMHAAALVVVAWNAYAGNRARRVRNALAHWIAVYSPHVVVVNEAKRYAVELDALEGYTAYQETPVRKRRGRPVDDRGDVAVLVRNDVRVIRHRVAVMSRVWQVLRYRRWHTPHRYEVLVIEVDGRRRRVRAMHPPTHGLDGPNRVAFLESMVRARAWALFGRAPSIIVGDLNETAARLAAWFGRRYVVEGGHIDLMVARNVEAVWSAKLPREGSDHNGRVYVVTPAPRARRRRRG